LAAKLSPKTSNIGCFNPITKTYTLALLTGFTQWRSLINLWPWKESWQHQRIFGRKNLTVTIKEQKRITPFPLMVTPH